MYLWTTFVLIFMKIYLVKNLLPVSWNQLTYGTIIGYCSLSCLKTRNIVFALNFFASFFVPVLLIDSWLLFFDAPLFYLSLLKAIAKSKGNLIAFTIAERAITKEREMKQWSKEIITKTKQISNRKVHYCYRNIA